MNILEVKDLQKYYGKHQALCGINFDVRKGEVFALIGPNGAGKTTTLRIISTLLSISMGDAFINGVSVKTHPDRVRSDITYLPDEAGAYKSMKGISYLKFMAELYLTHTVDLKHTVEYAAEICGLGDRLEDKISTYSKGMIRKLLISRAVMTKPLLAILDEPTSGLDIINSLEIRNLIKRLAVEEGISFLISGHNMLEIEYVSERVAIIDRGLIHAVGTPDELKHKYLSENLEEVFVKAVKNHA